MIGERRELIRRRAQQIWESEGQPEGAELRHSKKPLTKEAGMTAAKVRITRANRKSGTM
ncbi:DUF2934 domain-containing protein [Pseudorhizobium flavum]|uniref:DUF2934 domain-containing protein n=1 Tax=Pseudorhizobium flavum TaxID=1335061 RepID=UPI0011156823|nr:DUF2934 domain-containing protein [Pseudorhizobium flavum]